MRIKLENGKQNELISLAKRNLTWKELAEKLNVSEYYLRTDLFYEKRLLNSEIFTKLSKIIESDFSKFIKLKLEDNWGQKSGGKKSSGRLKKVLKPEKSEELAELIGIILGDGSLYYNSIKGVYAVKIAGGTELEKDYLINHVKPLISSLFNVNVSIQIKGTVMYVSVYSKEFINILEELGLKRGNKVLNNVGIPLWVFNDKNFLKACIRRLIDTDGSIFRMSKRDSNLIRINFKNCSKKLLKETREGFIKLGFNPSKIIMNTHFFLSRQKEIKRYYEEVTFNNPKHLNRLSKIIAL